jgi:putative ABC transport system permease protein
MRGTGHRVRALWRALWRSRQLEADMRDEMRLHIELEAERLERLHGLDAREARRQACVRFGGVERFKEEGREARGLRWLETASLDARLGVRMLAKHRWLTLVGGVAMAVAIALGATAFEIVGVLLRPALPLTDGERVVAIKYITSGAGGADRRVLHAFADWRRQLTTVEQLTAFRTVQHNLVTSSAAPEAVKVAEITASAFEVARTPPLAGRYLLASDEQESAAPVVVIGHKLWRARFAADPGVVGRTVVLGETPTTIVGIMPEGFGFPVDHQLWTPLRLNPSTYPAWRGPELHLFGRLAAGASIEQAEAELSGTGRRVADAHPERPERLQPVVLPFTREHLELTDPAIVWALRAARFLVGALTLVVAVNLAILLYARTITRLGEIAVRTALGASRGRILSQLFVEALALTLLGAAVGLVFARVALREVEALAVANGSFPFWIRYELTPGTVVYALALAVLAAVIMGVLPGLKATGARLSANLQELNGRAGTRLGSAWTTLIVGQVAIAVALLPAALYVTWHVVGIELTSPTVAIDQFVVANLTLGGEPGAGVNLAQRQRAVIDRLRDEPGVAAVTFSSAVPGFGGDRRIELDPAANPREAGAVDVASFRIAADLLTVYGTRLLAGRQFDARDTATSRAAIVNRSFAALLARPNEALGVRFKDAEAGATGRGAEWYEVVGVVEDFPGFPRMPGSGGEPTVYLPGAPGDLSIAVLSVRFTDSIPADVAERFRLIAAGVDPSLQLRRIVPLAQFNQELRSLWRATAWAVGIMTLSVLLLSAAGVQALLSFTIAQRTREIGIRSALGAQPRHLLLGIFGRAMRQLGIGVLVGSLLSLGVFAAAGIGFGPAAALLLTVAAVMTVVASLAALGPARRSLRIQTVEALRTEG